MTTPSEQPPPDSGPVRRPRRVWLTRFAVMGGVLALGVGGLAALGRSDWLSSTLTEQAVPQIKALLGFDVVLGRVELHPYRLEARIEGLALTHHAPDNPELHGAPVASLAAAEVDLGLRGRQPIVDRIELWRPAVHLRVGPDGLLELAGLELPEAQGERLPFEVLAVHDGRVVVEGADWRADLDGVHILSQGEDRHNIDIETLAVQAKRWRRVARDVELHGVLLAPGRVDVPGIDLDLGDVSLSGQAGVDGGHLRGRVQLDADLGGLAPLTAPKVRLDGGASVVVGLGGTTQAPELDGRVEVRQLLVDRLRPDGVRVEQFFGDVDADFELQNGLLTAGPITSPFASGFVELQAGIDLASTGISVSGRARGLQLTDLLKQLSLAPTPWVSLDSDLDFELAGTLSPLRLAGSIEADMRRLRVGDGPIEDARTTVVLGIPEGRAFAQLRLVDTTLDVDIHRFTTTKGTDASVTIDAELSVPPRLELGAAVRHLDLSVLQPLGGSELRGQVSGAARMWGSAGAFQAESELVVDGMGLLGFHMADRVTGRLVSPDMKLLRFQELDAQLGDTHYSGDIDVGLGVDPMTLGIDVVIHEGRLRDLTGLVLDLPQIDAAVSGSARLEGPWNRTHGDISLDLEGVDLFGEPFDWGVASASMVDGELVVDRLDVSRDQGRAGIVGRGRMGHGYTLDFDLHTAGVDLRDSAIIASSGARLGGAFTADVHVGGTAFAPEPEGRMDLRAFTIGRRTLGDASVHFTSADEVLTYQGLAFSEGVRADGTLDLTGAGHWSVDARFDDFDLAPLLPEPADGGTYVARVSGRVDAAGELDVPAEVDAELETVALAWNRHQLTAPAPWRLTASGGRFDLEPIRLVGGQTDVTVQAAQDDSGNIVLEGSGDLDLDLLRSVVPGMQRASGLAHVSVASSGPQVAPRTEVELEGALFEGDWFPHAFEGISGHITATPERFTLTDVAGRLGGGTFSTGGTIDADGFSPTRYALEARVDDARIRYLDFLPAAVGEGSLSFDGPADDPLLSGSLVIQDMLFAERIDWESWVLEFSGEHLTDAVAVETGDYFNLDLTVTADETIRLRNNVGDLTVSADLQFMGNTARPGLTGRVRALPGGRVLLKERDFEINRAELLFNDPYAYDPDVDIDILTQVSTRDQDYDINYLVGGLYSDWRTTTRSDPALPQADINALLLFGLTMEELERYGGAAGALAVEGGDLLASKLGIVERVGQGVVGLDTLRPERIDLVSGVSERGSGTVSSDLRLLVEKDLDWATLIFEQNLSRSVDTYLGLERRLARMFYLRTYWAREQVDRRLDIGGAYGFEASVRGEVD